MRGICILCLLLILTSCNWLESAETKTQKLVDLEMQTIDFNTIDQYPLFDDCDELASIPEQRQCFEKVLLSHFSRTLNEFDFTLESEIIDTLYLDFLIDNQGKIVILDLEENQELESQLPEFEGIIARSLKNIPPIIAPATKRGIPVTAKFRIPLIINTN